MSSVVSRCSLRVVSAVFGRALLLVGLVISGVVACPGPLFAGASPCVHFDVAQLASCRPLADAELADRDLPVSPGEMLIEATFSASTLIRFGQAGQIRQLLFVIESPTQAMHVVDYAPRTALATRYAGNIERTEAQDETRSMGLSANFQPHRAATAQGTVSNGNSASESLRFQLLPPQELVLSSGTIARGKAVFFKFLDSPQTTLDGDRQLSVVFRVPANWRADYVHVRCAAFEAAEASARPICGSSEFLVPLYLVGDAAARDAAVRLAQHDLHLRRVAFQLSSTATEKSFTDKLAAMFGQRKPPKWPKDWLHQVLTRTSHAAPPEFVQHLPAEVQDAIQNFYRARQEVGQLEGSLGTAVASSGALTVSRGHSSGSADFLTKPE